MWSTFYQWCLFLFSSPVNALPLAVVMCRHPCHAAISLANCHHVLCILISRQWLRSTRARSDLAILQKILFWYYFPWCFACSCRRLNEDYLHSHMTKTGLPICFVELICSFWLVKMCLIFIHHKPHGHAYLHGSLLFIGCPVWFYCPIKFGDSGDPLPPFTCHVIMQNNLFEEWKSKCIVVR